MSHDPHARLDDYVRGHAHADDDAYEDDLFTRAAAGAAPELQLRDGMQSTFRGMEERGTIEMWLTRAQAEELRRIKRAAWYELDFTNPAPPPVHEDVDIMITRVPLELAGVRRLEAEVTAADGRLLKRMPDIAFDPSESAVYLCCEIELARASAAAANTITHVYATDERGERRLLASLG